jgi:hypothetical protein
VIGVFVQLLSYRNGILDKSGTLILYGPEGGVLISVSEMDSLIILTKFSIIEERLKSRIKYKSLEPIEYMYDI